MKSEFLLAFNEIAEMRKLPREVIMEALQAALVSAYRRNSGVSSAQLVEARVDGETGLPTIWVEKEVVDQCLNEHTEIAFDLAVKSYPEVQLGDMVMVENTPSDFGRIAAQTAKQVILQRMREAEREAQFQEYQERVGDLVTGTIQSESGGIVTVGLGRTEAILPSSQQMPGERYRVHDKVRAYVMDVKKSNRGPQIVVSRTHRNMLRRLLEYEVPEIYNGTVEIKSIAREPGHRSKVAVAALQEGADPVGACVGMKGVRIQSIVKELNNEKIDVIEWNPDQQLFISKALSPARVSGVFLDDDPDEGRTAIVVVPDDQLSLAIGREGQNARLAAKLTGWRIDIKSVSESVEEALRHAEEAPELGELAAENSELAENVRQILEKKQANKPVTPEDYALLIEFTTLIEDHRISLQENRRRERRQDIEAARALVPPAAYEHPLDDTDLPLRVYNKLSEHGYQHVGHVMEKFFLNQEKLFDTLGLDSSAQQDLIAMIELFKDAQPEVTDAGAEPVGEAIEASPEEAPQLVDEIAEPEVADVPQIDSQAVEASPQEWTEEDEARARRAALVAELTGQQDGVGEMAESVVQGQGDDDSTGPQMEAVQAISGSGEASVIDEDEDLDTGETEDLELMDEQEKRRDKGRRRQLVYDEDLGRVVAKRKRKRSGRKDWDSFSDET